ncbi:DUF4169 family protein [Stakelama marina]|uniref:DUF4169 family protein n=1 Tax=Stakelama marina TaxID=2826939 RepID=A0A8T4IJQ7_9SPHN|nr:DUF4169 family protein [Stakelama marina]MBR0552579.1 DUF4169 family protein [Stakelama marina]
MGEVVNLRLARKAKKRAEKEQTAATNRAAFGQSKAEKAAEKAESDRQTSILDGAKRD